MNKQGIILSISVLGILAIGIVLAVVRLYSTQNKPDPAAYRSAAETYPMISAVPSDAAAIFAFDGSRTASRVLNDSTGIMASIIAPDATQSFRRYLSALSRRPCIISLHNSGTLIPLIITDLHKADSLHLASLADSAGLKTVRLEDNGYLLASRSETLLKTSVRNVSDGISPLMDEDLSALASTISGPAVVFLNNDYLPKLSQPFTNRPYRKVAEFLRRVSSWTALTINPGQRFSITARPSSDPAPSFYANVIGSTAPGEARYPEMLPEFTSEAISFSTSSIQTYIDAHQHYLDAKGRLSRYDKTGDRLALQYTLKEAAVGTFYLRDSAATVLLMRSSSKLPDQKKINPSDDATAISNLLGTAFNVPGATHSVNIGEWRIIGSLPIVTAYSEGSLPGGTLKSRLSSGGQSDLNGKDLVFTAYFAANEAPSRIKDVFAGTLSSRLTTLAEPGFYTPFILTTTPQGSSLTFSKSRITRSKAPVQERDTTVNIPTGPFKVKNSGTGKINTFYQNSALSLCLNDENGKGLWGVPFKHRLCGRVQEVDFYANGKIQFLFAASDKLYLMDRLGRFVSGFPVSLGKEVKLGPDAYDFSGAHSYRAMILHNDNTLELYDLHGRKADGWLGIKAPETVKDLPSLIEVKGKKYWIVRTSIRTLIYPFNGGDTLTKADGDKMIRPDAELTVTPKGTLSAACYDGKVREIKL